MKVIAAVGLTVTLVFCGCGPGINSEKPHATVPSVLTTNMPIKELAGYYADLTDAPRKSELVYLIASIGSAEALQALERMFAVEQSVGLRADILDAMSDFKLPEAVASVGKGLNAKLPVDVRLAAIDALVFMNATNAVPLLEKLYSDPDSQIQQEARAAVEMLQTPVMSPAQFREMFQKK